MATINEVLGFLIPLGGYVVRGETYSDIEFLECEPITEAQFNAGFAQYDTWKTEQDLIAQQTKDLALAKLTALGLTKDDLKALGL